MKKASDYIKKRKELKPNFAKGYDEGLVEFKLCYELKEARVKAGVTQEELAEMIDTKKSAISRMERHAQDIRVSTLEKIAAALGKKLTIKIS